MLLLDIGNSVIKSAQLENQKIKTIKRFAVDKKNSIEAIEKIIHQFPATHKILASVSNKKLELEAFYKLNQNIQIITSTKSLGQLKNGYTQASQLGSDRWLNMITAWDKINSACCVIDCGTCITYDQIDETGQHLGGFILPGKNLTQNAMQNLLGTGFNLKANKELGKDTNSAVTSGFELSFISLIKGLIKHFTLSTDNKYHSNILVTGGDADLLYPQFKGEVIFVDNMVINGLLLIANSLNNA